MGTSINMFLQSSEVYMYLARDCILLNFHHNKCNAMLRGSNSTVNSIAMKRSKGSYRLNECRELANSATGRQKRVRKRSYHHDAYHKSLHKTKQDRLCIVMIFLCLFIYLFICYLYLTQYFTIMRVTESRIPLILQHDLLFPYSINTSNVEPSTLNIKMSQQSYIEWLQHPSTLCWNWNSNNDIDFDDDDHDELLVVLTILYDYSYEYQLLIRNNRMMYALLHDYTYCELSDYTASESSSDIIKQFKIHSIDKNKHYKRLWYKLHFIEYLLGNDYNDDKINYVLWIDADAIILNLKSSIKQLLHLDLNSNNLNTHTKYNLYISNDRSGINSGVFLLKNSNWTKNNFLKYVMSDNMMHFVQSSTMREQVAIRKYQKVYPFEWNKNVKIVDNLQALEYSSLFDINIDDGIKGQFKYIYTVNNLIDLPLTFHFCYEADLRKREWTIRCSMIKSQPLWLLDIMYNSTNINKSHLYHNCKSKTL